MSYQRDNIAKMAGYVPGEQLDSADVIKLNTNENPYPPSPAVNAALQAIDTDALRRYPSPMAQTFREAAARYHNIAIENIIPTNGGDELLRLVLTTFVEAGEVVAVTKPSYSLYPVLVDIQASRLHEIPLQDNWDMPVDFIAQLNASGAKLCILVNPHAPTGGLLATDTLKEIADNFSGLLLVDEAYVDFVEPTAVYDAVPLAISHGNIMLLRTLSKGYSLAGLRFGYGIGAAELVAPMLYKTRDSYNTDYIAQKLATAAIESVDYARGTWQQVRQDRRRLAGELTELGFDVYPSQSNFLLCRVPAEAEAKALYEALKESNILVRYFDQHRLRDKLRITVGSNAENKALITRLRQLL